MRKTGECAYCGQIGHVTKDHVVPKCLFVPPYPRDLITVKACTECNNKKSLNDDFLRDTLVVDAFAGENATVQALGFGKVRSAVQQDKSVIGRTLLAGTVMRPYHTPSGVYIADLPSIDLDGNRITKIFATIVRGLYCYDEKQRIPEEYEIEAVRHYPWDAGTVMNKYAALGMRQPAKYGDVFWYTKQLALEDPFTSIWFLGFYESIFVSVNVFKPGFGE